MKHRVFIIVSLIAISLSTKASGQWVLSGPFQNGSPIRSMTVLGSTLFESSASSFGRSSDDGVTWPTLLLDSVLWYYASDIFKVTTDGHNLFVASFGGVFVSADTGSSWRAVNNGLPDDVLHHPNGQVVAIGDLVVSGSKLYAIRSKGDVYVTTNSGASWSMAGPPFTMTNGVGAAASATRLFLAYSDSGVYRLSSDGQSWESVGLKGLGLDALVVSGNHLIAGASGGSGIYVSTDEGTSWIPTPTGDTGNCYTLLASGNKVFASGMKGSFMSTDRGMSWINIGWIGAYSFAETSTNLFASDETGKIWRRPLSEINASSAVLSSSSAEHTTSAYPNPFSKSTTVSFTTDLQTATTVSILSPIGTEITRLFDGTLEPGEHTFTWDVRGCASGMYLCIVRSNGMTQEVPIMLAK